MSELWIAGIATAVVTAGGAAYSAYSSSELYGDKPDVGPAPTLGGILTDTLDANIAGLPKAAGLASAVNDIDQARILRNLRSVVGPDFLDKGAPLISENILSGLKGEVDPDTQDALQNFAAAKSLGSTGNSLLDYGAGRKLLARDFSQTSRDITNQAMGSYKEWLAASRALLSPNISAASFLATPGMGQSVANREWDIGDYMAKIAAAPDPSTVGAFQSSMSAISTIAALYAAKKKADAGSSQPWLGTGDFTLGQASQMYGTPQGGGVLGSFYGG